MKRCRTCNRTYTDPNLSYCIDDGTPLTTEVTEDVPYRPPSAHVPSGTMPPVKRRRAWPWIVGILGAFILGVVALMIAAAIFVPRILQSRQANPPVIVTPEKADPPQNAVDTPAPADETQVLAQLTEIENEWTVANINADRQKLDRILADDYVGQGPDGLQGKKQYLEGIQRDRTTDRWEFEDLKVQLSGNRATLTGKVTFFTRAGEEAFNFVDKFVWRDGRWQATASEIHRIQ